MLLRDGLARVTDFNTSNPISKAEPGIDSDFKRSVEKGADTVDNVVDRVTGFGDDLRDAGDRYTDFLIDTAEGLQNRVTGTATENISKSKVNYYFSQFGNFVQDNFKSVAGFFAGAVLLIFVLRRF